MAIMNISVWNLQNQFLTSISMQHRYRLNLPIGDGGLRMADGGLRIDPNPNPNS